MSTPGWYPDPGGRSGHFRFWDGQTWAPTTTANPAPTAPGGPSGPPPRGPRRPVGRWLLVGAVLLVVLAVVGALVVRNGNRTIVDHGPAPSTTTGGGDISPAETPSLAPTPIPSSPSPESPTPSPSPSAEACPVGNPFARQDYARDGRVHGGGLSFPRQSGWEEPGEQVSSFTWAYDVGETDVRVEPQWYASYAVGAVSVADGFEDPRSAAELAMRCSVGSALYRDVTSRTDLVNEETTVDGYPAWTLRSEIRVADDRTTSEGDTVQITVVDQGSGEALSFFWGCAPIGDPAFTDRLDQVAQQLSVG
ncbi:DUF2510 domain-containing protein [Microlunatus antarcticus]|uniref:DUF2510 domain-containing protein n=1 Tax=Microlunatus antarcticus TaxID=53388 RepID=A0A7W5P8D4_9ACTN|nr:hypothetical protein [Microlunatus antarcticus]